MPTNRTSRPHGFTLVELLVVIAIIAVLVTITATMTFRFRKSADRTSAMNAMRQIQTANISYAMENAGSFVPPEAQQVDADGIETGETYQWFENPDFISQLKGVRDAANDLRSLNKLPFETIRPAPAAKAAPKAPASGAPAAAPAAPPAPPVAPPVAQPVAQSIDLKPLSDPAPPIATPAGAAPSGPKPSGEAA